MRKSILAISTATAAALLIASLAGCSSNTNSNENINATARGGSADNAVTETGSNISGEGEQTSSNALMDPAELSDGETFEIFDDVSEEELAEAEHVNVSKNEPKEYSGWYKVAFPDDMLTDEYEDYFMHVESDAIVYSVEIDCDMFYDPDELAAEEEDPDELFTFSAKNAQELAQQTAVEEQGKLTSMQVGAYTWYVISFEDVNETYCYMDLPSGEYACIWFEGISITSSEAQSILSSFEVLPGDPFQNFLAWSSARFG